MHDAFVTFAGGTRLVCINSWNDKYFFLDPFLNFSKTGYIFTHRIFVIGRTWSNDNKKFIGFTGDDLFDLLVANLFLLFLLWGKRV